MGKSSERTLRMKQEFITLHKDGLTIPEIAKRFDLTVATIYANLQEIADAAGVSRESLLARPHAEHAKFIRTGQVLEKVNPEEFNKHYGLIIEELKELRGAIKDVCKDEQ